MQVPPPPPPPPPPLPPIPAGGYQCTGKTLKRIRERERQAVRQKDAQDQAESRELALIEARKAALEASIANRKAKVLAIQAAAAHADVGTEAAVARCM